MFRNVMNPAIWFPAHMPQLEQRGDRRSRDNCRRQDRGNGVDKV